MSGSSPEFTKDLSPVQAKVGEPAALECRFVLFFDYIDRMSLPRIIPLSLSFVCEAYLNCYGARSQLRYKLQKKQFVEEF